jgi:hypothetical protein
MQGESTPPNIDSFFDGFTQLEGLHGTDVTVPKMANGTSGVGGPFHVTSSSPTDPGWTLFNNDFNTSHSFPGFTSGSGLPTNSDAQHRFLVNDTEYSHGGWVRMHFAEVTSFNSYRLAGKFYTDSVDHPHYAKAIALFGLEEDTGHWTLLDTATNISTLSFRGTNWHSHRFDLGTTHSYKSVILQMKETMGKPTGELTQFQLLMH